MDYQSENDANAIPYMRNDVHGLYHAVRAADKMSRELFGIALAGKRPDIITAGALAKRVLLEHVYGLGDPSKNVTAYQREHRTDLPEIDAWWRKRSLYRGGMTLLNAAYGGRLHRLPLYKYDVNSMYPFQISIMPDLVGLPRRLTWDEYTTLSNSRRSRVVAIYEIYAAYGHVKDTAIPTWYDPITRGYVANVDFSYTEHDGLPYLMFGDEFEELRNWYDFDEHMTEIRSVIVYDRVTNPKYKEWADQYYKLKADAKRAENKVMETLVKLVLNSSYGKIAENPIREDTHREINPETSAVVLISDGEHLTRSLLSVVQGALISSMARCQLMRTIRRACRDNPRKYFVYADTDSIACLLPYDDTDAYTLGALKDETGDTPINFWKYLAPKTYMIAHVDGDNVLDLEVHTKGVPTKVVLGDLKNTDGTWKTPREISRRFAVGQRFQALSGMNIVGGKALIPLYKELVNASTAFKYNDGDVVEILEDEIEKR